MIMRKHSFLSMILGLMMSLSVVPFAGCDGGGEPTVKLDPISATVDTWSAPETFGRNNNFKVEVSEDGEQWTELAVYNVKNGHQIGDKLINQGGATYFGEPYTASMSIFDFSGTVGIRVTYSKTLTSGGYVISPDSYGVKSIQDGNTVTFTLTQDENSPRKVVFRPVDQWEAETLHILTNVPDSDIPDESASNVYVVEAGAEVPLYLPAGKDTYFFKAGMHDLPQGYWVELDLQKEETVSSFDLMTPVQSNFMPGGVCFDLQAKTANGWTSVYKSQGEDAENNFNLEKVSINPVTARYFRLVLLGNFNWTPTGDYRFIHTAYVSELSLFNQNGQNVAKGKSVAGAGTNFALVTDGNVSTGFYGHPYAGENFNVMSNTTYYLEKGSVLNGAFLGKNRENVTVRGRGILDGSVLTSTHELSEGRNGSIHFEYMENVEVEGITMMHAPMWMCVINHSVGVLVDGVNLFGYTTNSDGIHFSASHNAVATGCFIRTTDDLFVAYHYGDSSNLQFRNSVLWGDGGKILLLGLATEGNIRGVKMENCDVINYQNVFSMQEHGGFAQIVATGGKTISDVTIKDVRIDKVRFPIIAQFLQIRAGFSLYGTGHVKNVKVENVSYASECKAKSLVAVIIPGGSVSNVSFKDVTIAGDKVTATNYGKYFSGDPDIEIDFK